MTANARVQLARVPSVLLAAVAAVAFTIIKKGNDMVATASVSNAEGVTADVADDTGKIRVFKDVDDFIKAASKLSLITSESDIAISLTNPGALEPAVFTGDIVKRTVNVIAGYEKNIEALTVTSGHLASAIALLPASTPGEVAYKAEKQAQKTSVDAQKTYLAAEVVRLTALLP